MLFYLLIILSYHFTQENEITPFVWPCSTSNNNIFFASYKRIFESLHPVIMQCWGRKSLPAPLVWVKAVTQWSWGAGLLPVFASISPESLEKIHCWQLGKLDWHPVIISHPRMFSNAVIGMSSLIKSILSYIN